MLYLISTPIGNLQDISARALSTLQKVDIVACEDTRTSGALFTLLGIKVKKMIPLHDFNEKQMSEKLIPQLKQNIDIALVSDAGTPLISDPGYKLVNLCYDNHIPITTIPGANAVLSALQLSGLPSDSFLFAGFLPPKTVARQKSLASFATTPATLIFYETGNRLCAFLADAFTVLGNRKMAMVREITKKFEEVKRGTIQELLSFYTENGAPKGELVLVFDKYQAPEVLESDIIELIAIIRANNSVKDTAAIISKQLNINKKIVYQQVLDYDAKHA